MTQAEEIKKLRKEAKSLLKAIEKLERPKESKPKLEVGKWYKGNSTVIINYQGGDSGYGINGSGNWEKCDHWSFTSNPDDWQSATDKEVEEALIKEAKKRGFKKGIQINQIQAYGCGGQYYINKNNNFCFTSSTQNLAIDGIGIYQKGKWAEIIKDKVPTINGYEMEDKGCMVKFGCENFDKGFLKNLYECAKHCRISSFTLKDTDADDFEVSLNQLKEVVEYLNKKQ